LIFFNRRKDVSYLAIKRAIVLLTPDRAHGGSNSWHQWSWRCPYVCQVQHIDFKNKYKIKYKYKYKIKIKNK
jgi:hypothetical protein